MKLGTPLFWIAIFVLAFAIGSTNFDRIQEVLSPSCSSSITYSISELDARFNISEEAFKSALADAAAVWNTAAGRTLIEASEDGEIRVNLEYGSEQEATELGVDINTDQEAYNEKKVEIEKLKTQFDAAKRSYEAVSEEFEEDAAAYKAEVEEWNAKGGAPPKDYARLGRTQQELEERRITLNEQAKTLNGLTAGINEQVDALNVLASKINGRVGTYNAAVGHDYDQGWYREDATGKSITIVKFENGTELRRVLTHEFGHALGLGHVENPESIMYSYDIGSDLVLSEEDKAELNRACALQ